MQGNNRSSRGRGQARGRKGDRASSVCRFEEQGVRRNVARTRNRCATPLHQANDGQNTNTGWRVGPGPATELSRRIDENRSILESIRAKLDSLLSSRG